MAAYLFFRRKRSNGVVTAVGANHSLTGDKVTDLGKARVIPGLIFPD